MSRRDVELLLLHWLLSDAFAFAFVMAATLEFRGSDSFPSQDLLQFMLEASGGCTILCFLLASWDRMK